MTNANYWTRHRISRRAALRGAGVGAAGLAGAALIGCGDDDDDDDDVAGTATAAPTSGAAATTAPASTPSAGIQTGGTLTFIRTGDPPSIDPYGNLSYLTKGWAVHMYSRLYQRDAKPGIPGAAALPGPDLAVSTETDDGMTYIVKLNPAAKFQNVSPVDGRDLIADDVSFSWDRLTAPESTNASQVEHITGLEVIDDHTLKFTHDKVNAVFLDNLADANLLWVMPTESDGGFNPELDSIGSGPWIVKEFTPDVTMEFKRNPDWHLGPERPYVDELHQPVVPEYANQLAQLQAQNLDWNGILSDDVLGLKGESKYADWQWIANDPGSTLNMMLYDHLFALQGEPQTTKPWKDERVRQATSMSLDRAAKMDFEYNVNAFKEAGLNPSEGWHNFIPVGQSRWWLDPRGPDIGPAGKFFEFNVDEAKKLLAAADVPDGFDATFIYNTNRYGGRFGDVQEANIAFLEAIGIMAKVEIQDYSSQYINFSVNGEFDGIISGWQTPWPEAGSYPLVMFDPEHKRNSARVDDPELWELSQRQVTILDVEERREMLWEIQRRNALHMYYIPMTYGGGAGFTAAQPWVRNIGVYRTQGYGASTETRTHYWIDQEEKKKHT
jgi:peptide/nickel transport system substrate-binding protein